MDKQDIIRMAQEAGIIEGFNDVHPSIERFAAAAYAAGAAAEREACARVCDALGEAEHMDDYWYRALDKCAAAIRARRKT